MSDDLARTLRLLERVGYEGTPKEFEETLEKFRRHPEAVKALRKGVDRRGKQEDRGNYLENATPGYGDWLKKQRLLDKIDLEDDRAFLQNVDPARLGAEENPSATLAALQAQVRELTEKVERLERLPRLPPAPKLKGGNLSP